FLLCSLFLGDGFLALVGSRSSLLRSSDQLCSSLDVISEWGLLLFGHRGHELLELFKSGNRIRNRIRLAEVGNAELVVSLSHSWVVLDGFLERIGSFLGPSAVGQ